MYMNMSQTNIAHVHINATSLTHVPGKKMMPSHTKNGHTCKHVKLHSQCISLVVLYRESYFVHLQSGPVSIEVQRWFNLQCIVPKIITFK